MTWTKQDGYVRGFDGAEQVYKAPGFLLALWNHDRCRGWNLYRCTGSRTLFMVNAGVESVEWGAATAQAWADGEVKWKEDD